MGRRQPQTPTITYYTHKHQGKVAGAEIDETSQQQNSGALQAYVHSTKYDTKAKRSVQTTERTTKSQERSW